MSSERVSALAIALFSLAFARVLGESCGVADEPAFYFFFEESSPVGCIMRQADLNYYSSERSIKYFYFVSQNRFQEWNSQNVLNCPEEVSGTLLRNFDVCISCMVVDSNAELDQNKSIVFIPKAKIPKYMLNVCKWVEQALRSPNLDVNEKVDLERGEGLWNLEK